MTYVDVFFVCIWFVLYRRISLRWRFLKRWMMVQLRQYLNCKIFALGTLQPWPNFNGNYVIPPPQLKYFFPETRWRPKKMVFTAIWDYIRPQFGEFIRAGWLLIVSSSSAQISMGGRLNLDGGKLNLDGGTLTLDWGTRPPYNLSTELRVT